MILAPIRETVLYRDLLVHEVWRRSLNWLSAHASTSDEGIYPIDESVSSEWYANVHSYETKPADNCVWENHRDTIDIQYITRGVERIDWTLKSELESPVRYIAESDREEFAGPKCEVSRIKLSEGMFVIFLPGEVHRPMAAWDSPLQLSKTVVKIPTSLFAT